MSLISYLPSFMQKVKEIIVLFASEEKAIDEVETSINSIIDDAFILSSSEDRINEWTKNLGVVPSGTVDQKKVFILSLKRGGYGKLNEYSIKSIVESFTGSPSKVTFSNSTLTVEVFYPISTVELNLDSLRASLASRMPAHINLVVFQNYKTWGELSTLFNSWQELTEFTWRQLMFINAVKNLYIDENSNVYYREDETGNAILVYADGEPFARLYEGE